MTANLLKGRSAYTLIEVLVAIAIVAVLIGLLLPAVQKARESASVTRCRNNLKQLALALHIHEGTHGTLPPGHRSASHPDRLPYSGWTLTVLPYVEQQSLYDIAVRAYTITPIPVISPPHTPLSVPVPVFLCPSDPRVSRPQVSDGDAFLVALTSYLGCSGQNGRSRDGVLYSDSRIRLTDVSDGTSNTLMAGERPPPKGFRLGWWYAGVGTDNGGSGEMHIGVRETNGSSFFRSCPAGPYRFKHGAFDVVCDAFHFWSPHSGGANFAFADGSVRFLTYEADAILPALASRAGGEVVDIP